MKTNLDFNLRMLDNECTKAIIMLQINAKNEKQEDKINDINHKIENLLSEFKKVVNDIKKIENETF